jgi:transposase
MATSAEWAKRVDEWRATGESSEDFCEGRGFSPDLLRHWAYKLGKTRGRGGKPPARAALTVAEPTTAIRVARVVRRDPGRVDNAPLVVELAGARLTVPSGFEASTLAAVLGALSSARGAK